MTRKVFMSTYLTQEQLEKLRALSAATKVPVAVYIREGIDLVLEREQ